MQTKPLYYYGAQELPIQRVLALRDLINACDGWGVAISYVAVLQEGFKVMFEHWHGDAVLHDNSYCNDLCEWETIGFPWDEDDVSTHTSEELARLLGYYKRENGGQD